ncbi:DUF6442 family protein [Gracilibacillus phocaeensis]|uniref:DUF6442 family protein n=1 Tax=Gracilibacillus phocaeensis TaxID=2042304 RepID=UPI0010321B29|nr:DUF6442 family protein [Gracilibacillus phocaeensis]
MNNKEVLKKAQQEKNDEREKQIATKAFYIGWLSVSAIIILLIIFRYLYNEPTSDILMILMAQLTAASFYQYFHMRNKKLYLFTGILCTIAFFLNFAALLSQYGVY